MLALHMSSGWKELVSSIIYNFSASLNYLTQSKLTLRLDGSSFVLYDMKFAVFLC